MKLQVDKSQRYAKMRAHTATHLLHAEIAKFFPNTKQAGSMVDSDLLRFDFVSDRLLSLQELSDVEKNINQIIYAALDVVVNEMSIDEASKLGAKMFFEDKYGDTVRVVKVGDEDETISMEFCGGTHVTNTKDIGVFTILSQEAVASGVKRISAITGPKVIEKLQEKQMIVDGVMEKLGVKGENQITDRLDKVLKEYDDQILKIEQLIRSYQKLNRENKKYKYSNNFDQLFRIPDFFDFKIYTSLLSNDIEKQDIFVCNQQGNYAIISGRLEAKNIAKTLGLKGGGNDKIYQGRDMQVKEIYDKSSEYIENSRITTIELSHNSPMFTSPKSVSAGSFTK